jgi:PBP1b-binding outer membrane lipoprotein LpoB
MTTKIIFNLLLIVAVSLTACEKNKEVSAALPNDQESIMQATVLTEAKNSLRSVVPESAYNDLDWDNATFENKKGSGMITVVKSRKNTMDSLVYLTVGGMRMYQWAGEVHPLYK